MITLKNISSFKGIKTKNSFYETIMSKLSFETRWVDYLPLVYALSETSKTEEKLVEEQVASHVQNTFYNNKIIYANEYIKNFCLGQEEDETPLHVGDLIHQIAYETSRSYRLAASFRQLLMNHFQGYEAYFFNDFENKKSIYHHASYHASHLTHVENQTINIHELKRQMMHQEIFNEKLVHALHQHHTVLKHVKHFSHQHASLMTNEHQMVSLLEYFKIIKPHMLEQTVDVYQNLYSKQQYKQGYWLLKTLNHMKLARSNYFDQYQSLFHVNRQTGPYKMITYNQIIKQSHHLKEDIHWVKEMILQQTKERAYDIKNHWIHMEEKRQALQPEDDINPFHNNQRKNQNKIVTNLLGMIANEMSKNIAVRNMMNHVVGHTEVVNELRINDYHYNRWFMKQHKKEQKHYLNDNTMNHYAEMAFKKQVKQEKETSSVVQIDTNEFIKKQELHIEPAMLTEETIRFISDRMMENIEAKEERDYERNGYY